MEYLLLGGSGILGSGFVEAIGRRPDSLLRRLTPDWDSPDEAARSVACEITGLAERAGPTTVVWAAGVGQVGSSRAAMEAERRVLDRLCDALAHLPGERQRRIRLVYASSAGALFGGNDGTAAIADDAQPCPISDYGHEKLSQELTCRSVAAGDGLGVLICRYSNLYGLASGQLPAKGLIPAAIRAARNRQPMTIYVSADTRRDYVYGADAAGASLALAEDLPGGTTTALVAQGSTGTIAEIVTAVGSILGRRVPATFAVRPESSLQPRTLRFSPRPAVASLTSRTSLAVAIHRMVHAPSA